MSDLLIFIFGSCVTGVVILGVSTAIVWKNRVVHGSWKGEYEPSAPPRSMEKRSSA